MISLKEIRINSGFTQTELAKRLGIRQQQYSRYEIEENQIPLKLFFKMLKVCHYEFKLEKSDFLNKKRN